MKVGIFSIVLLAIAASAVNALEKPYIVSIHKVEMTATTTKTAAPVSNAFQKAYDYIQSRLPRSLQTKVDGHVITAVCTGTILTPHSVLTTVTCVEKATSETEMPIWISTAEDNTSVDLDDKKYIPVESHVQHPDYDAATMTNNLVILKISSENPIEYMDYLVSAIQWGSMVVPESALCDSTYWQTEHPYDQKTTAVTVTACDVPVEGRVCAAPTVAEGSPTNCIDPQDGSALVCGNQLAGIFTFKNPELCAIGGPQPYMDISKVAQWIQETTANDMDNAAPVIHLSVTALLALIYATVSNYC